MDTKNEMEGCGTENNQEMRVSPYKLFCKVFLFVRITIVSLMLLNKKQVFISLYRVN